VQVTYAACDALAAVLIFIAMMRMKISSSESADYSGIAAKARSMCQGVTDLRYAGKTSYSHCFTEKVSIDLAIGVKFILVPKYS